MKININDSNDFSNSEEINALVDIAHNLGINPENNDNLRTFIRTVLDTGKRLALVDLVVPESMIIDQIDFAVASYADMDGLDNEQRKNLNQYVIDNADRARKNDKIVDDIETLADDAVNDYIMFRMGVEHRPEETVAINLYNEFCVKNGIEHS